jgi:hypothetical protein
MTQLTIDRMIPGLSIVAHRLGHDAEAAGVSRDRAAEHGRSSSGWPKLSIASDKITVNGQAFTLNEGLKNLPRGLKVATEFKDGKPTSLLIWRNGQGLEYKFDEHGWLDGPAQIVSVPNSHPVGGMDRPAEDRRLARAQLRGLGQKLEQLKKLVSDPEKSAGASADNVGRVVFELRQGFDSLAFTMPKPIGGPDKEALVSFARSVRATASGLEKLNKFDVSVGYLKELAEKVDKAAGA